MIDDINELDLDPIYPKGDPVDAALISLITEVALSVVTQILKNLILPQGLPNNGPLAGQALADIKSIADGLAVIEFLDTRNIPYDCVSYTRKDYLHLIVKMPNKKELHYRYNDTLKTFVSMI